ncbi:uncharacterized protein F5Z01DRAFT_638296 [Emericellopsis atlantica]|uniref:Xylanolytic transcriptional activator regulatory domain-containing protein n=1 Tax=Emericellopsis atlantica TaxID=2614577 RepID=A0A9P7ZJ28_9HYPO|nr:uncharacterized protein F5Z01DRAFT_638296 [Emericellopsis atlantica]KAG9252423.1 hypothetical protein F5Z01DRAFT_638296 [Emericellopsis atlantica]
MEPAPKTLQPKRTPPSDHATTATQAKRTKVTSACLPCRRRKVKCDGNRPVCRAARPMRLNMAKDMQAITKTRVQTQRHSPTRWPNAENPASSIQVPVPVPVPDSSVEHQEFQDDPAFSQPSATSQGPSPCLSLPADSREPAWYGQVGRRIELDLQCRGRRHALGTASVGPLASNIRLAGASTAGEASGDDRRPTHPFQSVALERHNKLIFHSPQDKLDEADYELPRRAKADALLATYWELFPPSIPDFRPSRVDTPLNVATRERASARYCGRVLELLNRGRTRPVSIPVMQAALLVAEYLHSLHPEQCWMYAGMAIRIAQSLGLHRPDTPAAIHDPRALRLCVRVWKLCVVWDRILCMTYGRSMTVSQKEASWCLSWTVGAAAADGALETSRQKQVEDMASAFLHKCLELYMVIGRALNDFASLDAEEPDHGSQAPVQPHGALGFSIMDKVLRHERSLEAFQRSLPPELSVPEVFASTMDIVQQRHAVILHQRLYQARTALLRPLLSNLLRSPQPNASVDKATTCLLTRSIAVQCAVSCVAAAQETLRIVGTYHCHGSSWGSDPGMSPQGVDLTNTWWNNVLYLYTAATALLAARLCPEVRIQVGPVELDASWELVLRLFLQYKDRESWVGQLAETLGRLAMSAGSANEGFSEMRGQGGLTVDDDISALNNRDASGSLLPQMMAVPNMFLDGEMPLFSQAMDLDAIFGPGHDPFVALRDGSFGG